MADDREHQVSTHFHFASSSFFITVFNPLTVMAFGAAFAGRDLAGVGGSFRTPPSWSPACSRGALGWWAILCTASVALRQHFTGKGILWLNRIAGAVILAFGIVALISLLPLPWRHWARALNL